MSGALIVNCSAPHYNFGARKLADWLAEQGHVVAYHDGDPGLFGGAPERVFLSVIFSWHAPLARDIALRYRAQADVECGGPGIFALAGWWKEQTGLECQRGLDWRFERQRGREAYRVTFASRGCPVGCSFCIVPRVEGTTFTLDWDFQPAPILCDNNLSALPVEFQEHIVRRYQETRVRLLDANSGFEPLTFDEGTYRRWKPVLRGPWRFAFDTIGEEPQVRRTLDILKDESRRRKQVYALIGNEPVAACHERAQKVIEGGGEPFCQPLLPLNALDRHAYKIAFDWTADRLTDFARYYNRHLWRYFELREYSNRKGQLPIFANLTL